MPFLSNLKVWIICFKGGRCKIFHFFLILFILLLFTILMCHLQFCPKALHNLSRSHKTLWSKPILDFHAFLFYFFRLLLVLLLQSLDLFLKLYVSFKLSSLRTKSCFPGKIIAKVLLTLAFLQLGEEVLLFLVAESTLQESIVIRVTVFAAWDHSAVWYFIDWKGWV